MSLEQVSPVGLYIHIPWCIRKCPYCDFNSHELKGNIQEKEYVAALLRDLDFDLKVAGAVQIETIFLGGGTPSLFSPEAIAELLAGVRARVACKPGLEVSMEANPGTVESGRFNGFRQAGINRLSMGIQSFDDEMLKRLGRIHSGQEAINAIEIAQAAGFDNLNLDLMFGLPNQTAEKALADLNQALAFDPLHLSHYQLTIEPNTFFYKQPPKLPEDDDCWEIQQGCKQLLETKGYEQYEISAWSRPHHRCQHNLNYWRFGDYLGIGAGAHGKIHSMGGEEITRIWKVKNPRDYLQSAGGAAVLGGRNHLSRQDLPLEFIMNSLRLKEGFKPSLFESQTGLAWSHISDDILRLKGEGLLVIDSQGVRCSDKGWSFLDELLQRFVPS